MGKDNLKSMKGVFENPTSDYTSTKTDDLLQELQNRSEADKRRVHAAFQSEKEEEPTNCCICDKIVYPVEKVVASKKLYHTNCFKCSKCSKKLRFILIFIRNFLVQLHLIRTKVRYIVVHICLKFYIRSVLGQQEKRRQVLFMGNMIFFFYLRLEYYCNLKNGRKLQCVHVKL